MTAAGAATAARGPRSSALPARFPLVIGVTGHRDIPTGDRGVLEAHVAEIFHTLRDDCLGNSDETPMVLMSSLAEGADQLVARVALRMNIKLIAPLPMPAEEYRRDFDPGIGAGARGEFDDLLAQAIAAPVVPLAQGVSEAGIRTEPEQRALQYRAAGLFIVRHCDVLIALWDGSENGAVGGTGEIVSFKRDGIPLAIAGSAHDCLDGSEIGPVIHLQTSRGGAGQRAQPVSVLPWGAELVRRHRGGAIAGFCRVTATHAANLVCLNRGPLSQGAAAEKARDLEEWETFAVLTALTRQFNEDAAALFKNEEGRAAVDRSVGNLFMLSAAQGDDLSAEHVGTARAPQWYRLYGIADSLAQKGQRRFLTDWRLLFLVSVLGFGFFAMAMHLHASPDLLVGYSLALLALLFIVLVALARRHPERFLDYRALAEALRVSLYWDLIGLPPWSGRDAIAPGSMPPMTSYPIKQPNELTWVKVCLRKLQWLREPQRPAGSGIDPDAYRIARQFWVHGQWKYFERQSARHRARAARYEGWSLVLIAVTGLVLVPLVALRGSVLFAAAVALAPGLAAALSAYSERLAMHAQARQYERMAGLFRRAYELLPPALDAVRSDLISALFYELGVEAMKENADWVSIFRQRPMRQL